MTESDCKRVLAAYGIGVPAEALASSPDRAAHEAERLGFPVAIKVASADIPHKTEVQGIRLGLLSAEAVRTATAEVLAAAARLRPDARIDGVSVQQMIPPGVEIVVGVKRDEQFGPLIAVGLGGVAVELIGDTAVRMAPVTMAEAHDMLASLRTYRLLTGYRGSPPVDVDGLASLVCRVSELASDLSHSICEIDVNPVIVSASGAIAADALIVT